MIGVTFGKQIQWIVAGKLKYRYRSIDYDYYANQVNIQGTESAKK